MNNSSSEQLLRHAHSADDLFCRAITVVADQNVASPSRVQRHLDITYAEALAFVLRMEREGLVSAPDADGVRRVVHG